MLQLCVLVSKGYIQKNTGLPAAQHLMVTQLPTLDWVEIHHDDSKTMADFRMGPRSWIYFDKDFHTFHIHSTYIPLHLVTHLGSARSGHSCTYTAQCWTAICNPHVLWNSGQPRAAWSCFLFAQVRGGIQVVQAALLKLQRGKKRKACLMAGMLQKVKFVPTRVCTSILTSRLHGLFVSDFLMYLTSFSKLLSSGTRLAKSGA